MEFLEKLEMYIQVIQKERLTYPITVSYNGLAPSALLLGH